MASCEVLAWCSIRMAVCLWCTLLVCTLCLSVGAHRVQKTAELCYDGSVMGEKVVGSPYCRMWNHPGLHLGGVPSSSGEATVESWREHWWFLIYIHVIIRIPREGLQLKTVRP